MLKGMVRRFDNLGRITIPIEMRRELKLNNGDPVDIHINKGILSIKPYKLQCVDCGSTEEDNLIDINGVLHCRSCAVSMAEDMKKYGLLQ